MMHFAKLLASSGAIVTLTVGSIWAFSGPTAQPIVVAPLPACTAGQCTTTQCASSCSATQSPCNLLATVLACSGSSNCSTLAQVSCESKQTKPVAAKSPCHGDACPAEKKDCCEKTVPVSTTKTDCHKGTCPVSAKSECSDHRCEEACSEKTVPISTCGSDCADRTCDKGDSCEGHTCPVSAANACEFVCDHGTCGKEGACQGNTCPVSAKSDCNSHCRKKACDKDDSCEGRTCPVSAKSDCKDDSCDGATCPVSAKSDCKDHRCEKTCSEKTVPVSACESDCNDGTCDKDGACEDNTCPVSAKSDCESPCRKKACDKDDSCDGRACPVSVKSDCKSDCKDGTCQDDSCDDTNNACYEKDARKASVPVAVQRPCDGNSCDGDLSKLKSHFLHNLRASLTGNGCTSNPSPAGCEAATPRACNPVVAQKPGNVRARHSVRVNIRYSFREGPSLHVVRWSETTGRHPRVNAVIPPLPSPATTSPVAASVPMAACAAHMPGPAVAAPVPYHPLTALRSKLGPPVGVFTSAMFPSPRMLTGVPMVSVHHSAHPPAAWHPPHQPHPLMAPRCLAGGAPVFSNMFFEHFVPGPRAVPAPWGLLPRRPVALRQLPFLPPRDVYAPHPTPAGWFRMMPQQGHPPVPHPQNDRYHNPNQKLWPVAFLSDAPAPVPPTRPARQDYTAHGDLPITGTWTKTVGETTIHVTCERTRIHGEATVTLAEDESELVRTVAFSGTCSITPDGQLFGVVDYLSVELGDGDEGSTEKFESEMIDQPFAFRFRTDGRTLFIKEAKCPGLELMYVEERDSDLGKYILSAFVRGKYTRPE